MSRVLLADDDVELCDLLAEYLRGEGFAVECVHDGAAAVEAAARGGHDIAVLDVMMPALNGFDALREIRSQGMLPVLMLTARDEDVDRIVGLELGADDYLAKPCNPRELVARVRAILRRAGGNLEAWAPEPTSTITVGDVALDTGRRTTRVAGDEVELTATEFNLLHALMVEAGSVVTKAELCQRALGRKLQRFDRSVDVHVSNVRKKLGPSPTDGPRVKSVRGVGYIFLRPGEG